jgi:hypothetical protein
MRARRSGACSGTITRIRHAVLVTGIHTLCFGARGARFAERLMPAIPVASCRCILVLSAV